MRLKADKKTLAEQLTDKSGVSCMRSIGVGDYDIHAEDTKIEKVSVFSICKTCSTFQIHTAIIAS